MQAKEMLAVSIAIRVHAATSIWALAGACIVALVSNSPARAQYEPVIALSGRAGVPVVINGVDATGAVVVGDWGLARPGAPVTVIDPGPLLIPLPPRGAYFPATGRRPGYGRHEVDFPRRHQAAESYRRSWSSASDPSPATSHSTFSIREIESAPVQPNRRLRQRPRKRHQ
jgi:hypothetical protein